MKKSRRKGRRSLLLEIKSQSSKPSTSLVYSHYYLHNLDFDLHNHSLIEEVKYQMHCRYWQTAGEREGENPMKTPLPYIIIFGMSTPFVILAIGFANGWIKVPVR